MFAKQYYTMPKKNPAQISLFPEPYYHYHILLSPPEAIDADVQEMKRTLDSLIGIPAYNFTKAHLTLHDMEAPESVNIKDLLKTALAGQRRFIVKISGYDNWNHVLVLKIENPEPIAALADIVKAPHKAPVKTERQISILDKPKRSKLSMTPHITIARGLTTEALSGIEDFSVFNYTNEWLCDRVTILRRRTDSTGKYLKYAEIKLK